MFENSLHFSQRQKVYLLQFGQENLTAPFSGDTILPQLAQTCGLISDMVILLSPICLLLHLRYGRLLNICYF